MHSITFEELGLPIGEAGSWSWGYVDGDCDIDHDCVIRRIRVRARRDRAEQWHTLAPGSWAWKSLHDAIMERYGDELPERLEAERRSMAAGYREWLSEGAAWR